MASLQKQIEQEIRLSLKERNELKTSTLRMVIASIKNLAIEKRVEEIEDSDVLKIISKQVKQHEDSIESFKKGNRMDLVEKEIKELEILKSYQPEQLTENEVISIVKKILDKEQLKNKADFGKAMKACMQEIGSKADGKTVSKVLNSLLS